MEKLALERYDALYAKTGHPMVSMLRLLEEAAGPDSGQYIHLGATTQDIMDSAMGAMIYYNQGDSRWADYLYGGADPIRSHGCGPTAVAMVISSFSSVNLTPPEAADWAAANGYYAPDHGSYHSLIADSLTAFGLNVQSVKDRSQEPGSDLLREGSVLIALMGKGSLTQNGHFIVITKLLENGNVYIADPGSYANSTKEWELSKLLSELKGSRDSGAPLWAVSPPA